MVVGVINLKKKKVITKKTNFFGKVIEEEVKEIDDKVYTNPHLVKAKNFNLAAKHFMKDVEDDINRQLSKQENSAVKFVSVDVVDVTIDADARERDELKEKGKK